MSSKSNKDSSTSSAREGVCVYPRRRPGDGRAEVITVTRDLLVPYFGRPLQEVADELGVCGTTMKKICRKLGIERWPNTTRPNRRKEISETGAQTSSVAGTTSFPPSDAVPDQTNRHQTYLRSKAESHGSDVTHLHLHWGRDQSQHEAVAVAVRGVEGGPCIPDGTSSQQTNLTRHVESRVSAGADPIYYSHWSYDQSQHEVASARSMEQRPMVNVMAGAAMTDYASPASSQSAYTLGNARSAIQTHNPQGAAWGREASDNGRHAIFSFPNRNRQEMTSSESSHNEFWTMDPFSAVETAHEQRGQQ